MLYLYRSDLGYLPLPVVGLATPVEDPDRYAASVAQLAADGLHVDHWIHGFHKSTSGLDTTHPYMVDRPQPDAELYRMGPHPTNIWVGHYMIWQMVKCAPYDYWLVVECDTRPREGWRAALEDAWLAVPSDMDFLYIGSCCTQGFDREAVGRPSAGVYRFPRAVAPQCNHGYIIAKKAVPILERTLRRVWAPIDVQQASETFVGGYALPRCVPAEEPARRLHTYAILPRLFDQWNTTLPE